MVEVATATCKHCNRVVLLRTDRTRPREYCRKCDGYVCDAAGCVLNCIPMQRVLEMASKFPNEPHLLYGPNGEPLVGSPAFDKTKVY